MKKTIENRIMEFHDLAEVKMICRFSGIELDDIIAIVPATRQYLPQIDAESEDAFCIITRNGRMAYFLSRKYEMTTVAYEVKKIMPEDSGITLTHNDDEYFVCIPARTWYKKIKKRR